MKDIFLIFFVLNIISCYKYIIKAGQKTDGHCEKNNLEFQYNNCYFVNDLVPIFKNEFSLIIKEDYLDYKAQCKINPMNFISSSFEILCSIENYYGCMEGSVFNQQYIKEEPNSIYLGDNKYLSFEGFKNDLYFDLTQDKIVRNVTIIAGDLLRGDCNDSTYTFMFMNSTISGNREAITRYSENEIKFVLNLSQPIIENATCKIDKKIPSGFGDMKINISCFVNNSDFPTCVRKFGNNDLKVQGNYNNIINYTYSNISYYIHFEEFENKSTIIKISAGKLSINELRNPNEIVFEYSINDYNLTQNIPFKLNYHLNNKETQSANCMIDKDNSEKILCNIILEEKEKIINLTIFDEPIDSSLIPSKTLKFFGFKGKSIYTIVAGQLQKGKCNEPGIYKFNFTNSKIPKSWTDIIFKMNKTNLYAMCNATEGNSIIECSITKTGSLCPIEDQDEDISINTQEPSYKWSDDNSILYFSGFANKSTLTVMGKNIINKYEEKGNFVFIITYNYRNEAEKEDIAEESFNLPIEVKSKEIIANCIFEKDYNIICKTSLEEVKSGNYSDFKIKKNPSPIALSETVSLNFGEFENLTTYSIIAGKIELGNCISSNYQFRILNIRPSSEIPEEDKILEIKVKNTTSQNEETIPAKCKLKKTDKPYSMYCSIETCPEYIQLKNKENETDTKLFSTDTLFYYDFNDKRTISIKGGKLIKGQCSNSESGKKEYSYTFINNTLDYTTSEDSKISFTLYTSFSSNDLVKKESKCEINLSGNDNTSYCYIELETCPNTEDDIYITQNKTSDYDSLSPNSIFYSEFDQKSTSTIKTTNKTMIKKEEQQFIITDNTVSKDIEPYNVTMKINISGEINTVDCNIPKVISNVLFDITCYVENNFYSLDKDIEIIEEPEDKEKNYFFYGYQNKKTLTLKAGNLIRTNLINNPFGIINNSFTEEINKFEDKTFNLLINNTKEEKNSICSLNINNTFDNQINITCTLNDESFNLDIISINENPEPILLNSNITLNFINFDKISLSTLSLGKITKTVHETNKNYIFYFNNSRTLKSYYEEREINIPILINALNNIDKEFSANCIIPKQNYYYDQFNINISCEINDIDLDIIDISYKPENGFYNSIEENSLETIYIDNEELNTSTLNSGYIEKIKCENNIYEFIIDNNIISGNTTFDSSGGELEIKLEQFSQNANCKIENNNRINCSLNIDDNYEEEIKYCQNINEDIKIKEIIGDYILINNEDILYFHGYENLSTYTIESGDLFLGKCNGDKYEFSINKNKIYNNINNVEDEIEFNLNLSISNEMILSSHCNIPKNLEKYDEFNIKCFKEVDNCEDTFNNKDLIIQKNPDNKKYNNININFKNFEGKSTTINVTESAIFLSEVDKKLRFNFTIIDYELNKDIPFDLKIKFNDNPENISCILPSDKKESINCSLRKNVSDNFKIFIPENPKSIFGELEGKSIHFNQFENKEIKLNTLVAGDLVKGNCTGNNYHFSFINNNIIELSHEFELEMKKPALNATCEYHNSNNTITCTMVGDDECPVGEHNEIMVGEKNPEPIIFENNDILKFSNFINKTTLVYDIKVGNILKIGKKNKYYYYEFENFEFDLNDAKYFYENEIIFEVGIYFNNTEYNSICNITQEELEKFKMECYFELKEENYDLDEDDLMGYDIKIKNNVDKIKTAINCARELNLTGFNDKQTITLNAEKILDKDMISNKYTFTLKVKNTELEYLKDKNFTINIKDASNINKELVAICEINEGNIIICNDTSKTLVKHNDIEIVSNPTYIIINNTNYTYYFNKFANLRTYTIRASKIQKREKQGKDYFFRILNCKSPYIPETKNISLKIFINETIERTAQCSLQNLTNYAMSCLIPNETYIPFDIIFPEDTIETDYDLFSPNTVFYYDFVGKRTLTIKAGKLNRGNCSILPDNKITYNFTITDNIFHYKIDKEVSFDLTLSFGSSEKNSLCFINLSGEDNTINCTLTLEDDCPEYFKIKRDPYDEYYALQPNITLKYEEFANKEINIIRMNEKGKIIKTDFDEDNYNFIISNNSILGNLPIDEEYYFKININNNKTFANCSLPKNKANFFDISCSIINSGFSFSINDEIEILEEPEDLRYYFTGYKNKTTLTLEAGNIIKNTIDNRKFSIINNHFMSNKALSIEDDIEIILDIKYSENIRNKTKCIFNKKDIDNNYVNISCSLPEDVSEIRYISILNNPEPRQIDKNTTLNYYNFKNLNLCNISLGNIIKNEIDIDEHILSFYFANTTISPKAGKNITFNLSVNINNEEFNSKCNIVENKTKFNMECKIEDFSQTSNYDISCELDNYYNFNNYITIYIDNVHISTTTLKSGYLIKESCDYITYNFSIKNNILSGNTGIDINGIFSLRLREFTSNAICKIKPDENNDIKCYLELYESEKDFCSNMNKDINVLSINYKEYHYILINDNILHLNSFESLATHTVEAGDLIRGNCIDDNIYTFKLKDSLIYNNISNEDAINFNLVLSQPKELNAVCTLPKNIIINNKFDINCTTSESGDICPIDSASDEILKIKINPEDIIDNQLYFNNFTNKTTLILINAGILSKLKYESDNKKYYLLFQNSTSTYSLNKNINFNLTIEVEGEEKQTKCELEYTTLNITCEINDIESEDINIKLIKNPIDDSETIPEKIIRYTNFENKQINAVIAGKINKGQCEQNIYTFTIKDCISQYYFYQEFYLQLKEPNKLASCKMINSDDINNIYNIQCTLDETSTCESEYENKELIIDNVEPEYIRIDENNIVYFYKFKEQTTIVYEIKVGNLLKSGIDNDESKYYFKFDNEPFSLPNFKNNILFIFNMSYNNSQVTANCELIKLNKIENSTVDLNCYFPLNEDLKQRDDLLNYDLSIGQDINKNKKIINSSQELNLIGFDNKETLTLLGKNIKNKYEENNKINFIIDFSSVKKISDNAKFDIYFSNDFLDNTFKANCSFNIESRKIICEDIDNKITIDDNIIIKTLPNYHILNDYQTLYFMKFENIRTYTIKAGIINKLLCPSEAPYTFNLINTSSSYIPKEATIEIPILINDNENYIAKCSIQNSPLYNMSCKIEDITCPKNIILNNDKINPEETLFYPNTTFFNDFNNKRTITIKSGKIQKGQCESSQYHFTFIKNKIDNKTDFKINFKLNTLLDLNPYTSNCYINISGIDDTIYCRVNKCPDSDDDLLILSNPENDYTSMYPNSIFFESFPTKNTTTIVMSNSGLILKNQDGFIITQNYINEDDLIYSSFNVIMKVKINDKELESSCLIPTVKKEEIFNITCYVYFSQEDEIEIIEDPKDESYYFSGYKNKKTLTLKAGSLYKYNNENIFDIRNSNFNGEYPLINKFEFNLSCQYNIDELSENSLCSFSTVGVSNSDINIVCKTRKSDIEIKTITILNNPIYTQLNENITLYFTGFQNLNLYTLIPGNIIKGECESNSFTFNLIDTNISKSLQNQIQINIPLIINGQTNKNGSCQIVQDITKFNMSCLINEYCPDNNIDIKIEAKHITDIDIINPDSIYINIDSEKQTSTLNLGYLKKEGCENGNYSFSINNNNLSGKNIDNLKGKFKLKLAQFINEANCTLNSLSVICYIYLNSDEMGYCKNSNYDIKVEELIGDDKNYIILDNNNILHLYGIGNLETFTIEGGELNQGVYTDKLCTFSFNNSYSYNSITESTTNKIFSLSLLRPRVINANCSLPLKIEKETFFDIICEINGNINNYVIQTRNEDPKDIEYNTQLISLKEFKNKTTEIILTAGQLKLENDGLNNYYLNFTNSIINKDLDRDISFDIEIYLNETAKNITCNLYQNNEDLQCNLEKVTSVDIKHVKIQKEQNSNLNAIEGKTLTFKNFINKEINTLIAGYIEKGKCDKDGVKYLFYFRNCTSQINKVGTKFSLQMSLPDSKAECTILNNMPSLNLYDVQCSIQGENSCSKVNNTDFTVGTYEPEPNILSSLSALYYLNFTGQSTVDERIKYYFNGGIITKKSVVISDGKALYTFNIEDWSLNIPLNEDYTFKISISLDIYEDYSNKNYKGESTCTIPKGICDVNNTNIKIECSFTTSNSSYYTDRDNYDILIEEGDQDIKIDEDHVLFIKKLNGLSTITIYGCRINKGQCDSNNKYTFNFTSCSNPKDIPFEEDFEFNLTTKTGENSICKISNKNSIKCEIDGYSLCGQNNDVIIGNNEAQINYTKYPSYKNLYIMGLKNLYTSSLNGGAINFGQCQSTNFVFSFNHTKLTNELSGNVNFNISITEPLKSVSSCTIPKSKTEFDLQCVIKGEDTCPISDPTLLKIEEINTEELLEFSRPNALYINNFINKNIIELKAGTMTQGKCNDKKYELYFINSEIIGEIKGEITQNYSFTVNLNYPSSYQLNCIIPKDIKSKPEFDLYCYIEGYIKCPMYDYTYIEMADNNPDVNESLIPPNVLKFSNFNNQKINFDNYYLEIITINWACLIDSFNFNLTAKFNVNTTEKVTFEIDIRNNTESNYIKYVCSFSENIKEGTNSLISCKMKESTRLQKDNLFFTFDVIYLEEKNKYIINKGQTKEFKNNTVVCPFIHIENDPSIQPSINSTDNTLLFSMKLDGSLENKEIKIYDNIAKEYKDYLELKLKPTTSIKYYYKFLSLDSDNEFTSKCVIPKEIKESVQINCTGVNITDTKSEYFQTETNDQIEIDEYKFNIESLKIKNPFKKEDGGDDSDQKTDEGEEGGMSTAGKIVLIIFVILAFATIVLVLVYYFCFYRKRNNDSTVVSSNQNSAQQDDNRPQNNNNHRNQSNSQENERNSSEGSNPNSNESNGPKRRHINPKDQTFEYD